MNVWENLYNPDAKKKKAGWPCEGQKRHKSQF